MARRSEHTQEQIKEMVLQAAETIIVEEGYHALTVRKIALEIGYTVGSIYMVFENMHDLIMHIKGRTLDELAATLQQQAGYAGDNTEQRILTLATAYVDFAHQHFNRWQMIFDKIDDQASPDWYQAKIIAMFTLVEALLEQLEPNRSAEHIRLTARALWSGVHGACILALNGSLGRVGAEDTATTVTLLVRNFIRGWRLPSLPASA